MSKPIISVIIRTYNESKHIREVMDSIVKQKYKEYEVIIVDSESTDSTLEIVGEYLEYQVRIVRIKKEDFNFSYASNVGAMHASGDYLLYLSGHSVICREDYFDKLISVFSDSNIGGVYGDVIPFQEGGLFEKWYYKLGYWKNALKPFVIENQIHPGILSCSNAAIRRSIWEEHAFAEELGKGGEDVEMAYYITMTNRTIAFVRELLVQHSHHLNAMQFKKQLKDWKTQMDNIERYLCKTYGYQK